jgi:hypothetical protein
MVAYDVSTPLGLPIKLSVLGVDLIGVTVFNLTSDKLIRIRIAV